MRFSNSFKKKKKEEKEKKLKGIKMLAIEILQHIAPKKKENNKYKETGMN